MGVLSTLVSTTQLRDSAIHSGRSRSKEQTFKAALQSGSSTSQLSSINHSSTTCFGIAGLWQTYEPTYFIESKSLGRAYQGIVLFLLHLNTLHTRVCGFRGCTKILSAFTWSQKIGIKAAIRASGSCSYCAKMASRSCGNIGLDMLKDQCEVVGSKEQRIIVEHR